MKLAREVRIVTDRLDKWRDLRTFVAVCHPTPLSIGYADRGENMNAEFAQSAQNIETWRWAW